MLISTAVKYLKLTILIQKINILSAMEYRLSFLYQVIAMVINNSGLVYVWVIFFKRFPAINGWGIQETMLLYGISTLSFSIVWIVFFGSLYISDYIVKGQLDTYILHPKNILWNVSVSKTDISAIGDMTFAFLIFFISDYFSFTNLLTFILVGVIAAIIFYNLIVIIQSITFYMGNFESVSEDFVHAILGFTLYPQTIYKGVLRILIYTVIPAAFISLIPVQIIKDFNLLYLLILVAFACATFIIANFLFNKGLRRYESGNLINVKM